MGGIIVHLEAWNAMAVGISEDMGDYDTIFVFGMLQGPILNIGFAEIVGLAGGFGYNSHLSFPDVTAVSSYVLI